MIINRTGMDLWYWECKIERVDISGSKKHLTYHGVVFAEDVDKAHYIISIFWNDNVEEYPEDKIIEVNVSRMELPSIGTNYCCIGLKNEEQILDYSDNTEPNNNMKKISDWKVWEGLNGNHAARIKDATCSNCGYKHSTVYESLSLLSKRCPKWSERMYGVKYGKDDPLHPLV